MVEPGSSGVGIKDKQTGVVKVAQATTFTGAGAAAAPDVAPPVEPEDGDVPLPTVEAGTGAGALPVASLSPGEEAVARSCAMSGAAPILSRPRN